MAWYDDFLAGNYNETIKTIAPIAAAGFSTYMGSQAADEYGDATAQAAQVSSDASAQAIAEQKRQYDLSRQDLLSMYLQSREDTAPFRGAGQAAIQKLRVNAVAPEPTPFSYGAEDMETDPGYQFRLNEMMKALDAKSSQRGTLNSGQYDKDLARYVGGYASDEYQKGYSRAFNEYNQQYLQGRDKLSDLFQLAGYGQAGTTVGPTTAANLASLGSNTAGNVSNLMANQGQFLGGLAQAGGNARASSYMNTGSNLMKAAGMYYPE